MLIDFETVTPRHVIYGFGKLKVGEQCVCTPDKRDNIAKVRNHALSYATYHGYKFKTKAVGENKDQLAILRVK
jgi:hypothetical protein